MKRFAALGVFALVGLFVVTANADDPAPHPVTPDMRDAACSHCHEGPHAEQFDACGSCHTDMHWAPSTFDLAAHARASFALEGKHTEVACRQCHVEAKLVGLPDACAGCHIDRHRGLLGEDCTSCHAVEGFKPVEGFDHVRTGFSLSGKHASAPCASCHSGTNGQMLRQGKGSACETCHASTHADFGKPCESCHPVDGRAFALAKFDHRVTGWDLERKHGALGCGSCHVPGKPTPDNRCASCHTTPHGGQLGMQCQDCHKPDRWTVVRFDHDLSGWTLRGAHFTAPCVSCHTSQRWIGLSTECWDCHALDAARAPRTVDAHRFGRSDCSDCHTAWKWR